VLKAGFCEWGFESLRKFIKNDKCRLKNSKDSYIIDESWVIMICERIAMRRRNRRMTTLILMITMVLGFSGCTQEEVIIPVTEPTLEVTSEGNLIAYLVEDFDKDYYVLEELDAMVREEVAEYVAEQALVTETGAEGMAVESVTMAEDGSKKVVVALKFANSEIYEDYFDAEIFYGTVGEAAQQGYDLSAALTNVEDGELFAREDVEKQSKRKILITEEAVIVRLPKKVLYLGANAALTEDGFVDCTQSEGLKLMIFK